MQHLCHPHTPTHTLSLPSSSSLLLAFSCLLTGATMLCLVEGKCDIYVNSFQISRSFCLLSLTHTHTLLLLSHFTGATIMCLVEGERNIYVHSSHIFLFHSLLNSLSPSSLSPSLSFFSLSAGDTMLCLVEGECDVCLHGSLSFTHS